MKINGTKAKLERGDVVFGCALQQYRSVEIPRLLAAAGFDYLFIDAEHGGFGLETVQDLVSAASQAGITPLVRVGELLYSLVTRALDVGAQGIILPRVENPALLQEAIGWTKFPPMGTRGFGVGPAQLDYKRRTMPEIIDHLNASTMIIVQFETLTSMERCDDILSIPGIDVAMVGPTDLSISLGVPGEFDHPLLVETIRRFVASCRRHDVTPGIHCRSARMALPWLQEGMRLIGCGSEQGMLLEKVAETIEEIHAARDALVRKSPA